MDWLFRHEKGICHVRVTGVMLKDRHLLVQRVGNEYALPGGHLQFGETTEQALIREYKEETGLAITCQRLLWTEENFWNWSGAQAHNLGYYYQITADSATVSETFAPLGDNSSAEFGWLPLDSIRDVTIYPQFLKEEIFKLSDSPKHFVSREEGAQEGTSCIRGTTSDG